MFTDWKQKQKTLPQKYSLKLADYYIIISLSLHCEFHGLIGPEFCEHRLNPLQENRWGSQKERDFIADSGWWVTAWSERKNLRIQKHCYCLLGADPRWDKCLVKFGHKPPTPIQVILFTLSTSDTLLTRASVPRKVWGIWRRTDRGFLSQEGPRPQSTLIQQCGHCYNGAM